MRGGVIGWVGREHPVPGGPAAGPSGTQRLSASEGPHSSLPLLSPLPPCPPHLQLPLHQQKVLALIDTPPLPLPIHAILHTVLTCSSLCTNIRSSLSSTRSTLGLSTTLCFLPALTQPSRSLLRNTYLPKGREGRELIS